MTDVLGVCESWGEGEASIRTADGRLVRIRVSDIVSGKPVPARAVPAGRVPPADVQRRALALWPDVVAEPWGRWLLRTCDSATARRANSALAMEPAGVPDPVAAVVGHYVARGRRPVAAVLPGSAEAQTLLSAGWGAESDEADSLFQTTGIGRLRRALAEPPAYGVTVSEERTGGVLRAHATVGERASAVTAYADGWLGLRSMQVDAGSRRRGLGQAVLTALVEWGAEQGAHTAYLQVLADNTPAVEMYRRLGFTTHHRYRYLAAP